MVDPLSSHPHPQTMSVTINYGAPLEERKKSWRPLLFFENNPILEVRKRAQKRAVEVAVYDELEGYVGMEFTQRGAAELAYALCESDEAVVLTNDRNRMEVNGDANRYEGGPEGCALSSFWWCEYYVSMQTVGLDAMPVENGSNDWALVVTVKPYLGHWMHERRYIGYGGDEEDDGGDEEDDGGDSEDDGGDDDEDDKVFRKRMAKRRLRFERRRALTLRVRLPPRLLAAVMVSAGLEPGTQLLMDAFELPFRSDTLMVVCAHRLLAAEGAKALEGPLSSAWFTTESEKRDEDLDSSFAWFTTESEMRDEDLDSSSSMPQESELDFPALYTKELKPRFARADRSRDKARRRLRRVDHVIVLGADFYVSR